MEKFLNVNETAERVGLNRKTVYKLAKAGKIPHARFITKNKTYVRFPAKDIEKWIAKDVKRWLRAMQSLIIDKNPPIVKSIKDIPEKIRVSYRKKLSYNRNKQRKTEDLEHKNYIKEKRAHGYLVI